MPSLISSSVGKKSTFNAGDGFSPWMGKIPWRREWLPTPVFLSRRFQGLKNLVGYSSWGHKRVGQDWRTEHAQTGNLGGSSVTPGFCALVHTSPPISLCPWALPCLSLSYSFQFMNNKISKEPGTLHSFQGDLIGPPWVMYPHWPINCAREVAPHGTRGDC